MLKAIKANLNLDIKTLKNSCEVSLLDILSEEEQGFIFALLILYFICRYMDLLWLYFIIIPFLQTAFWEISMGQE
jgi:hypothetical protein